MKLSGKTFATVMILFLGLLVAAMFVPAKQWGDMYQATVVRSWFAYEGGNSAYLQPEDTQKAVAAFNKAGE